MCIIINAIIIIIIIIIILIIIILLRPAPRRAPGALRETPRRWGPIV